MRRRARGWWGGFTFVELLVAATMTSVLFLGLGAHLHGGIAVWRRTTAASEALQRQRVALDRLGRDLANAILYDSREDVYGSALGQLPAPRFEADRLAWFTVAHAAGSPRPVVQLVSYRCESNDGQQGLWRSAQRLGPARAQLQPAPELILPGCEELSLRYAESTGKADQPLTWTTTWDDPVQALPRLVEGSIRLAGGQWQRRLFAIPSGLIKPAKTPG